MRPAYLLAQVNGSAAIADQFETTTRPQRSRLLTVLRSILAVPSALLELQTHRSLLFAVARLARGSGLTKDDETEDALQIRALAHLLLLACAGDGHIGRQPLEVVPSFSLVVENKTEGNEVPNADSAVASLIRRLEHDGKQSAASLDKLRWLCSGGGANDVREGSEMGIHVGRHGVDRDVQRAVLAQLISHSQRADTLLLSLELAAVDGSVASTSDASLMVSWRGDLATAMALGMNRVPLVELGASSRAPDSASAQPRFVAHERLRNFLVAQVRLLATVCHGSHWMACEQVSRLLPFEVCLKCVEQRALTSDVRSAFVRVLAAAHVPLLGVPIPDERLPADDAAGGSGAKLDPAARTLLALVDSLLGEVAAAHEALIAASSSFSMRPNEHAGVGAAKNAQAAALCESLELAVGVCELVFCLAKHGHVQGVPSEAHRTHFAVSIVSIRAQLGSLLVRLADASESPLYKAAAMSKRAPSERGMARPGVSDLLADAAEYVCVTLQLLEAQSSQVQQAHGDRLPLVSGGMPFTSSSLLLRLLGSCDGHLAAAALRMLAWEHTRSTSPALALGSSTTRIDDDSLKTSGTAGEMQALLQSIQERGPRCIMRWEMAAAKRSEHEAWRDMNTTLRRFQTMIMPSHAQTAVQHDFGRGQYIEARQIAGRLGAVQILSALLAVVPDATRFGAPELRAQLLQLHSVQSLAMRCLAALCEGCETNKAAVVAVVSPMLGQFLGREGSESSTGSTRASSWHLSSPPDLADSAMGLLLFACDRRPDLCAAVPKTVLAALLRGAMRQLKEAHARTLKALCTASKGGHDLVGRDTEESHAPIDEAMHVVPVQRWTSEVVRAAVATDLAMRAGAMENNTMVEAPLLAWLRGADGATAHGHAEAEAALSGEASTDASAVTRAEGATSQFRLREEHAPLLELLSACASGLDPKAQAACRFLLPLDAIATKMELTPSPSLWCGLAQLLLHAYLRGGRAGTSSSAPMLRSVSMLRAMWSFIPQLKMVVQGDGHGFVLTRVLLPCVQAFVAGNSSNAQLLASGSSAPQRALLSALHDALLAVARHHVAVGKAGLKFAALEGGGRRQLDSTIALLETCCTAHGRAIGAVTPHSDHSKQGYGLLARRTGDNGDVISSPPFSPSTAPTNTAPEASALPACDASAEARRYRALSVSAVDQSEASLLRELCASPTASFSSLIELCRACLRHSDPLPPRVLRLALRLLRGVIHNTPQASCSSQSAASFLVELLASDAFFENVGGGNRAGDAAAGRTVSTSGFSSAGLRHERLEICAALLNVGQLPLRRLVEATLKERPWLAGLCARALLMHIRIGLQAARSPLLTGRSYGSASSVSRRHADTAVDVGWIEITIKRLLGSSNHSTTSEVSACEQACQLDVGVAVDTPLPAVPEAARTAELAQAVAALPVAVSVCEALHLWEDDRLRGAIEWQLAGSLRSIDTETLPSAQPRPVLGFDPPPLAAAHASFPSATPAAAPVHISTSAARDALLVNGWRWAFGAMPRWTTTLSCALILLMGGMLF